MHIATHDKESITPRCRWPHLYNCVWYICTLIWFSVLQMTCIILHHKYTSWRHHNDASNCAAFPYLDDDGETTCEMRVSRCLLSDITPFCWRMRQRIHNTLVMGIQDVARCTWQSSESPTAKYQRNPQCQVSVVAKLRVFPLCLWFHRSSRSWHGHYGGPTTVRGYMAPIFFRYHGVYAVK